MTYHQIDRLVYELYGLTEEEVNLENGSGLNELMGNLTRKYPKLSGLNYKIAVNRELVDISTPIYDRSEVAILSPFAGG